MSFGGAILWYMRINSFNWKKVHWIYVWSKVRTDQRGNRSAKKGQVHQVLSTLSCWLGLLSASFRKRWCGFRGRCAASAIRWWPPTRAPTWCVSAASAWPSLSPLSSITSTTCCSPTTRYSSWGSPILCTDGASTCNGFIRRGLDYFLKKKHKVIWFFIRLAAVECQYCQRTGGPPSGPAPVPVAVHARPGLDAPSGRRPPLEPAAIERNLRALLPSRSSVSPRLWSCFRDVKRFRSKAGNDF